MEIKPVHLLIGAAGVAGLYFLFRPATVATGSQSLLVSPATPPSTAGGPSVLDTVGKTLMAGPGVMELQTPYTGPPTPGAAPNAQQMRDMTVANALTYPAPAVLYRASMAGKRIIATQGRGGSLGGTNYEHDLYFKIAEPTETIPLGWFSFLEPGAADAVYRSAGIDPSTLASMTLPATRPFNMATDQFMMNHTASQVAFVEGLAGRDAAVFGGDDVAVQILDAGKTGGWHALDLLIQASSIVPLRAIYLRTVQGPFPEATLLGQTSSYVPSAATYLTLVAPDARPKDPSCQLLFAPNQFTAAVLDSKLDISQSQATSLPALLVPSQAGDRPIVSPPPFNDPVRLVAATPQQVEVVKSLVGRDVKVIGDQMLLLDTGKKGDLAALDVLLKATNQDKSIFFKMVQGPWGEALLPEQTSSYVPETSEYLTIVENGQTPSDKQFSPLFGPREVLAAMTAAGLPTVYAGADFALPPSFGMTPAPNPGDALAWLKNVGAPGGSGGVTPGMTSSPIPL